MPKLPDSVAQQVDAQESSNFEAIPPGRYPATLRECKVSDRPGATGSHYWIWEYEVSDGEHKGRRLWNNTSLSDKAAFKMKETFDAFGVPANTDTDELCGKAVTLAVSTRVIPEGGRKGELGNQIDRVLPADGGPSAGGAISSGQPDDDEDLF